MPIRRLLRLRHECNDMGFLAASLSVEGLGRGHCWLLRVESPSSADEYRDHLSDGASMTLSMTTRDGTLLRGEAYVSSISDGVDAATVVLLAGAGPLTSC